jgi:hypoxanthine phosphoribosyltransferase
MATEQLREVIGPEKIGRRVKELGAQISADYPSGNLLVVGVLKGCFMFLGDLVRTMSFSPTIEFMRLASYGSATETSGVVEIKKDIETSVEGRDVLVVEDIIYTGLTMQYLLRHLRAGEPRSLKLCSLLDKPSRRRVPLKADYLGFEIEDLFVVGYGLDYNEKYRSLPGICVVELGE